MKRAEEQPGSFDYIKKSEDLTEKIMSVKDSQEGRSESKEESWETLLLQNAKR